MLDGFERSKGGRGQAFSIIAEAGVGKSRLLYEFRKAVANEDVTFLEGRCLSYSRGVSYHPVIDVLKSNFDIAEGDGHFEIREKAARGLKKVEADEASTLPYLLELLSVKDSGIDKIPLSPEAKKDRILEAVKRIVLRGSEIRPLILAYEDLHWIDKSSEEYLKDLLDTISGARVFLIFTYRPEFVHTWGGRSYHSQVNLNRLSNRESLMMVSHLLGTGELDKDLEELVLEKTEGVPFFIEELISSLKDQRIIEKKDTKCYLAKDIGDVTVPSTIQDVIMARVDSLSEGAKGLLQTGAVAGRKFGHDLIKRVTDLSEEELWSHLSVLRDSELLYERGIYPQSTYVFKHALTQEVAYNTLLHKRRRETHEKIGKAMEQIYADRLEEFYEILAYHSMQGEDWQRAYRYNLQAGLKALSLSVYEEAQRYFEAALSALQKLPDTRARIEQEIDLRFNMRSSLFPLGRHDDWADHVRAGEALAKEIGDKVRLAKAYNYLSSHHWFYHRHREAIELCEEGLRLAEAAGDFSVQISTMFHLGVPLMMMGEYERQVKLHREVAQKLSGAAAFERHGMAGLPSVLGRGSLAWGLAELGEFEEAEAWGREGIEIAEHVKNALSSTFIYTCLALAYLRSGKLDPAIELLEKALALCRGAKVQSSFSFSAASLGHVHLLMGRPDLALPILEQAARPQNLNVSFVSSIYPIAELADAYLLNGQIERAIERSKEALAIFRRTDERGFGAWVLYAMAKIQASQGTEQMEQAIHSYRQAIDQATELGMRPLLAHCHLGLGQLYLRSGRIEEARTEIEAAVDLYRSMDMSFWLPQAETALAEIAGVAPP